MDIPFIQVDIISDEEFRGVATNEVAEYLALKKSTAYGDLQVDEVLITADTIVVLGDEILNKASSPKEAEEMLQKLSGKTHEVRTGVCIRVKDRKHSFTESTSVSFTSFDKREIDYYLKKYRPYDKAGAYGIQEWLGLSKIRSIEGCYYNVMGLPCARLYEEIHRHFPEIRL